MLASKHAKVELFIETVIERSLLWSNDRDYERYMYCTCSSIPPPHKGFLVYKIPPAPTPLPGNSNPSCGGRGMEILCNYTIIIVKKSVAQNKKKQKKKKNNNNNNNKYI